MIEAKIKHFFYVLFWGILSVLFSCVITVSQVTTTIGYGSPNKANSYSVHGSALGAKEVDATRKNLGWPYEPFHVPEDVKKCVWGVRDVLFPISVMRFQI